MIKSIELGKEIIISAANKVGLLAGVSKILADHGINIEGVAGYKMDKDSRIMLVTDDDTRATDALKKAGYSSVKTNEVVVIELVNKPGVLKSVSAMVAKENIDINYAYGTTCSEGCPAKIILSTSDNEKVLVALKK